LIVEKTQIYSLINCRKTRIYNAMEIQLRKLPQINLAI